MDRGVFGSKFLGVTGISLVFFMVMLCGNAFAREESRSQRGYAGRGGRGHEEIRVGHERYHYRDGRFFRLGWFGFEIGVIAPPVGVIVTTIPSGHRTVIVRGTTYYAYDDVYYTPCPSGYIVVPPPAVSVAPAPVVTSAPVLSETVTVNVPNANGSYTAVPLVRRNNGYVGPQGEFYSGNPTVDQLKTLYGK
jgi:hypothetical protein